LADRTQGPRDIPGPTGHTVGMRVERADPASLAPPAGFAHAVVATESPIVFLAGPTALTADGTVSGAELPGLVEQDEISQAELETSPLVASIPDEPAVQSPLNNHTP
jgi:hypothetical protein